MSTPAKPPPTPPARQQTARQALHEALRLGPYNALELSQIVGITEKDVIVHLQHLARSLKQTAERLEIEPAHCIACNFIFRKRDRLTRPGACPVCGERRIVGARFSVRA